MAAVGEGSPGNVPRRAAAGPSVPRQPRTGPAPLPQARLARPCSPRESAVASGPRRLRRSVTARQRTRTNPLPPQRRAPLAAQASAVVRGRSDWPKAASITAPRTPPSAGDSLWACKAAGLRKPGHGDSPSRHPGAPPRSRDSPPRSPSHHGTYRPQSSER